jgi:hypothetical protein
MSRSTGRKGNSSFDSRGNLSTRTGSCVANPPPLASQPQYSNATTLNTSCSTRVPVAYRHFGIDLHLSPFHTSQPSIRSSIVRTEGTSRQADSISKKSFNINTGRDPTFYRATTLDFALRRHPRHFFGHCRLGPSFTWPSKAPLTSNLMRKAGS